MKRRVVSALVLAIATATAFAYPGGYSIGLNFGADEPNGGGTGTLAPNDAAGVASVKQKNWNNLVGATGSAGSGIVGDNNDVSAATSVTVDWTCPNTWSSTGRGEENNGFTGADRSLLTGYLDTGNATTTTIAINNLPNELTSTGYNVYVYFLGGAPGRGGAYRIIDPNGNELKPYLLGTLPANTTTYIRDVGANHQDTGNYLLFKGLSARNIIVEATTEVEPFGGTPRAPVNAIQIAQAPDQINIADVLGSPTGFTVTLEDSGRAVANLSTIALTFDGGAVAATSATKNPDGITTVVYRDPAAPLASGSVHQVKVSVTDTLGRSFSKDSSFTVPAFKIIPATAALPAGTVDTGKPGFLWRVHQTDAGDPDLPNTLARAEDQLAGLHGINVADPNATGPALAVASPANPASAPIEFAIPTVINLNQDAGGNAGNAPVDDMMPGIPGTSEIPHTDNISAEILTALDIPAAGLYTMIVNSDDGFRTSAGANPKDLFSELGSFDGGRGATDTVFMFWVEAPGLYAFRTIWQEGGGGANIEWLTVLGDGTKVLINDKANNAQAIEAYQLPTSVFNSFPAYVRSVSPASGLVSIGRPKTVEASIVDAGTQVDTTSVSLKLNGQNAAVTATKTAGVTKVVHNVVGDLLPSTLYTAELTFSDNKGARTIQWTFRTGQLSSTLFLIEAEDFDYSVDQVTGGLTNPKKGQAGQDVDVMPYFGGAYAGLSAVEGIDFRNNDGADSDAYRTEVGDDFDHEVNINDNLGGGLGNGLGGTIPVSGSDRGSWSVTANYKIGWVEGGSWQNYTRTIPANPLGKWWKVYAALSYGGSAAGQLSGSLDRVTSGVGTDTQEVERLGQFGAPGSSDWGRNNLVPMKTSAGAEALVKLDGKTTLRFNLGSGDFDFILLSAAAPPPPFVDSTPPDSVKRNEVVLDFGIRNTDSSVNISTIKLFIDGKDASAKTTVTATATGASIHFDDTGTMYPSGELAWQITFNDTSTPAQSVVANGKFVVNPYPTEGVFVIEAEDFNYSSDDVTGGKTNPQKGVEGLDVDVMPYLGGAYMLPGEVVGLSAIEGVDYNNNDGNESDIYRSEKDPNGENEVNLGTDLGNRFAADRGVYQVTANYRIGWVENGSWQNYTRTFPAGNFNVWAALSFDGRAAGQLSGSLASVVSDPAQPNQVTQRIGTFNAPGSAGWGRNELVPMKNDAGEIVKVTMGGVQTVRFNLGSGDFDYLVFVPAEEIVVPKPRFTKIQRSGGNLRLEWEGGGTLEVTDKIVGGTWNNTQLTSPATIPESQLGALQFGRIRR